MTILAATRSIGALLAVLAVPCAAGAVPADAAPVPAIIAGNVVVLTPHTERGVPLRILMDTGGFDLIDAGAAARAALPRHPVKLGTHERFSVPFPAWREHAMPRAANELLIARPGALHADFAAAIDATIGPSWLYDHPLRVDYRTGTVAVPPAATSGRTVPLTIAAGPVPVTHLARTMLALVPVEVAGESLTMLLDTGATAVVRPAFRGAMPDAAAVRQISFASPALFARWQRAHPDWRYLPAAFDVPGDPAPAPAILVSRMRVAGAEAAPVWFVLRRDAATFKDLSRRLRTEVSGDLGGDALRRWRVTFDLRRERLLLE